MPSTQTFQSSGEGVRQNSQNPQREQRRRSRLAKDRAHSPQKITEEQKVQHPSPKRLDSMIKLMKVSSEHKRKLLVKSREDMENMQRVNSNNYYRSSASNSDG